jgi:hydroxymethylpyrimidine pyrophosphatase-like HAD family hydrolase
MVIDLHEDREPVENRPWIVCDLDGTLANIDHRVHLAENKQWDEFNARSVDDTVNSDVVAFLEMALDANYNVLLLTGKSAKWAGLTQEWLVDRVVDTLFDHLIMRPEGDFTPDHEVKPRMLIEFFGSIEKARESVLFVLEDRDRVVEAWRNLGFYCWQPRAGGY